MRVGILKSVKAAKLQETELDRIAYMMQFSQEICTRTQIYRQYLEWNEKWNGKKKNITRKLKEMKATRFPAFAPCALFYDGKSRENVVGLTDLCYLDIDHIKEAKQIGEAMNMLREDPHVVMASRSLSNEGLHILIRYKLKDMEEPLKRVTMTPDEMQEVYAKVHSYFAIKYQQKLGLMPDPQAGHMEHLYIVSYDPELYYNPNAETMMLDLCNVEFVLAQNQNEIYLHKEEMKQVKEVIVKTKELLDEADEKLESQNGRAAWEKIEESKRTLKQMQMPEHWKKRVSRIKKRISETERKLGALNREIKWIEKERRIKECKYIIRGKEEYANAVLYLIKKFETLQRNYEQGDKDNCVDILDIISASIDELPEDLNKDVLQAKYEEYMKLILKETT